MYWKNGSMKGNSNFEFDSRCPDSIYVPAISEAIAKLDNSLLQQEGCTWAYLGDGGDKQEANRYLFWTSLDTNEVGVGKQIPVIIQTGDGKYDRQTKRKGLCHCFGIACVESVQGDSGKRKEIFLARNSLWRLHQSFEGFLFRFEHQIIRNAHFCTIGWTLSRNPCTQCTWYQSRSLPLKQKDIHFVPLVLWWKTIEACVDWVG